MPLLNICSNQLLVAAMSGAGAEDWYRVDLLAQANVDAILLVRFLSQAQVTDMSPCSLIICLLRS